MNSFTEILKPLKEQQISNSSDILIKIIDLLRKQYKYGKHIQALDYFISLLQEDEHLLENFSTYLKQLIQSKYQIRLFTDQGGNNKHSFTSELKRRMFEKILPPSISDKELLRVVLDVFHDPSDYQWIQEIPSEQWQELFYLLDFKTNKNSAVADEFYPSIYTSVQIIAARITALGLEQVLVERLPHYEDYSSPFQVIATDINKLIDLCVNKNTNRELLAESYSHIKVMLNQCRKMLTDVERAQRQNGVTIELVYLISRIRQNINSLERIIGIIAEPNPERRMQWAVETFVQIITFESTRQGVANLFKSNTERLVYEIIEYTKQTGEHYITRTPKEYFKFLKQSMWGGFIISFTTWIKFIFANLKAAPLAEGFLFGLNYAASFLCIFFTHSTLATKQPAMTASALASALGEQKNNDKQLKETSDLIVQLIRSQLVSFLGNLIIVWPLPFFIAWIYYTTTGDIIVPIDKASKTMQSLNPVESLSLFYAAITGVFLYLSGLVQGYYENWIHTMHIGERIRSHRTLKKYLSLKKLNSFSVYIERNYGGIAGNVFLGFALGFMGVAGIITGLPLDIRHITLAAGSSAMAYFTIGNHMSGWDVTAIILGVLGIGFINFLVSFSLSLYTAMRSRKVPLLNLIIIGNYLFIHLATRPMDFFYPPKKEYHQKIDNE